MTLRCYYSSQQDQCYFNCVSTWYSVKFLLVEDFNVEETEGCMNAFRYQYDLQTFILEKPYFSDFWQNGQPGMIEKRA